MKRYFHAHRQVKRDIDLPAAQSLCKRVGNDSFSSAVRQMKLRSFTLIELLVVIAIIAILVS